MKKRDKLIILAVLLIAIGVAVAYFTFFHIQRCPDIICFNSALSDCSRRSYIDEVDNAVWLYEIKGKTGDKCVVRAELAQLREGGIEMTSLEGKDMLCYLPLGVVTNPKDNLDKCHGLLKEELQKIIISNLHSYITENLGKISEELAKPLL